MQIYVSLRVNALWLSALASVELDDCFKKSSIPNRQLFILLQLNHYLYGVCWILSRGTIKEGDLPPSTSWQRQLHQNRAQKNSVSGGQVDLLCSLQSLTAIYVLTAASTSQIPEQGVLQDSLEIIPAAETTNWHHRAPLLQIECSAWPAVMFSIKQEGETKIQTVSLIVCNPVGVSDLELVFNKRDRQRGLLIQPVENEWRSEIIQKHWGCQADTMISQTTAGASIYCSGCAPDRESSPSSLSPVATLPASCQVLDYASHDDLPIFCCYQDQGHCDLSIFCCCQDWGLLWFVYLLLLSRSRSASNKTWVTLKIIWMIWIEWPTGWTWWLLGVLGRCSIHPWNA